MRKLVLSVILILLMIGCYEVVFGKSVAIREKVASLTQLENSSKVLNSNIAQLEKLSKGEFEEKKKKLAEIIEDYKSTKQEYEEVVSKFSNGTADNMLQMQENELKDIYDVDFLWTIVGNYATEEGINLKFDVVKNTTSSSSISNTSSNYIVCDLKFVITGNYVNLSEFIRDLEDDDRLNFEINDFDMQKVENDLQVILTVKAIKVNSNNLIESSSNFMTNITQSINNTTTNTTTTNTTTNTTNTTSSTVQNSTTTQSVN